MTVAQAAVGVSFAGAIGSDRETGRATTRLSFQDIGLWIGVDKMLAPFRETVKI
jgi:hypothetical protein